MRLYTLRGAGPKPTAAPLMASKKRICYLNVECVDQEELFPKFLAAGSNGREKRAVEAAVGSNYEYTVKLKYLYLISCSIFHINS